MKEIRAYIRRGEVNQVVERLHDAGAPGVSIIEIHPLGYGYEANPFERNQAGLVDRHRYLAIVKLEIVCTEAHLEQLVQVIEAHCRTGVSGDGMIFVSDVVEAVRLCDGSRGEPALTAKRLRKGEGDARASAAA